MYLVPTYYVRPAILYLRLYSTVFVVGFVKKWDKTSVHILVVRT